MKTVNCNISHRSNNILDAEVRLAKALGVEAAQQIHQNLHPKFQEGLRAELLPDLHRVDTSEGTEIEIGNG
jgi:hypothetical protein